LVETSVLSLGAGRGLMGGTFLWIGLAEFFSSLGALEIAKPFKASVLEVLGLFSFLGERESVGRLEEPRNKIIIIIPITVTMSPKKNANRLGGVKNPRYIK
jgi:hypothetical protein